MEEVTYSTAIEEEEEDFGNERFPGDGYRSLATSEDEFQLRPEQSNQFSEQNSLNARSYLGEVESPEAYIADSKTEFLVQVEASSTGLKKYAKLGGKSEEVIAGEDVNYTLFEYPSEIYGEYGMDQERIEFTKEPSSTSVIDRLTIVRPKEEPCVKERMKKWLNRSHDEAPSELFLGGPYIVREKNCDDPYSNAFPDRYRKQGVPEGSYEPRHRGPCSCVVKKRSKRAKKGHKQKSKLAIDEAKTTAVSTIGKEKLAEEQKICICGPETVDEESQQELNERKSELVQTSIEPEVVLEKEAVVSHKICTCGKKKDKDRGTDGKCDWFAKRIGHLTRWWFRQKSRVCYCLKTKNESKKPKSKRRRRCICKRRKGLRRKFKYLVKKAGNKRRDEKIAARESVLRAEKIDELLRSIGPKLAADFKGPPLRATMTEVNKSNSFVKKTMKEFGDMMRKNRLQRLRDNKTLVHSEPDKKDEEAFQYVELPNGSSYYGQFTQLGMEGKCIYKMAHGPIFVGHMIDGMMEGNGRIIYPCGSFIDGFWINGKLFDPKYTFNDGLKFKPVDWKYCRMPDRRFASEIVHGMKSPDNVQLCADHPARQIPTGCLDAEEGFYDPKKKVILHRSTGKIIRIIEEQEGNWILQNCRRRWFEEVPFSRYMYENWYPGTVFPPPGDEPDWFDIEFPKVEGQLSRKIEDVLLARKCAMESTMASLRRHNELLNGK